jgi:spore maturation protein CgeB
MRILCVLGEYQYGDPKRGPSAEYTSFLSAFQGLGHEVHHFESRDRTKQKDLVRLNRDLVAVVQDLAPEVVFSVQDRYEIWLDTWQCIAESSGAILINWTTDDSWKYSKLSRYISPYFDVMATTYPDVVARYREDGHANVFLTQWGASSATLQTPVDYSLCGYPVTFIGTAHGDRMKRIEYLSSKGIEVTCFGHGWQNGVVSSSKMLEIFQKSIISLNFSNSYGRNQIKARTFEISGAGGFLLTENAPYLNHYFVPGREIDVFEDMDEACVKIDYYLSHPDERNAVANAGFSRTMREHTYEQRLLELLEYAYTVNRRRNNSWNQPKFDIEDAVAEHRIGLVHRLLRGGLLVACRAIWGVERGPRAARRILFEVSLLIQRGKTFCSAGWPGRYFPGI